MTGIEILAGGAILGAGASVVGQISAANAQKEAAEKMAALKNEQANELLSRETVNESLMLEQGERLELAFGALQSETGGAGTGTGGILRIHREVQENIANTRRDAEFKAKMLRAGAKIETNLASDLLPAAYLTGAGTLLTGAANTYALFKGPSKPEPLPKVAGT